ncbi:MAG TPA: globin [Gammaproteobacteria bacterium]|jgi:hemoglobin|nr:globin [Gammaproteobacteria bacterium]
MNNKDSLDANVTTYGVNDNSYKAAGELSGITKLVDDFYDHMTVEPTATRILAMHPSDLSISRKKLSYFLSGWLGGPKLYQQNWGGISIPGVHNHLAIDEEERDAWMLCMNLAVNSQPFADSFKKYLLEQLFVPADRVRQVSQQRRTPL